MKTISIYRFIILTDSFILRRFGDDIFLSQCCFVCTVYGCNRRMKTVSAICVSKNYRSTVKYCAFIRGEIECSVHSQFSSIRQ